MTLSEVRKGVVAVLGAVTTIIPQVLATGAGLIPQQVATWLTVIAAVATATLVYLVPNSPKDTLTKVRTSVEALGPLVEVIQERVRREVNARLPQTTKDLYKPEPTPDPQQSDPFVVKPIGG